jgi:hypothetical protein
MSKNLAHTIETLHTTKRHLITPVARQAQSPSTSTVLPIVYRLCLGLVQGIGIGVGWLFIQTLQSWAQLWLL